MSRLQVESFHFVVPSGEIDASLYGSPSFGPLSVVLPGAGYSCKGPLLHFLVQGLLKSGHQVLTIDSLYAEDRTWRSLSSEEALQYVRNDVEPLFAQIQSRFPSGIHTLIGRSLGTYIIACALEGELVEPAQIVWQCPSLDDKWAVLGNRDTRGLVIIGNADPRYESVAPFLSEDSFVAETADHAMELADPIQSIELLKQITNYTLSWIRNSDLDISQLKRNAGLTPEQRLVEHQVALELCDELARAGREVHEQSQ